MFRNLIVKFGTLVVLAVVAAACSTSEEGSATAILETTVPDNGTAVTEAPSTTVPEPVVEEVATPVFEIIETEDVSFALATRLTVRAVVPEGPYTEAGLTAVAEAVVAQNQEYDAISIFMYRTEAEATGVATLGTIDWAPNGVWADAGEDAPKQFSFNFVDDLETAVEAGEQTTVTDLDNQIFDRFDEFQGDLVDAGQGDISNEETAELLAPELGLSPDEILEIVDRVFDERFVN